jgi:hypothetical protein
LETVDHGSAKVSDWSFILGTGQREALMKSNSPAAKEHAGGEIKGLIQSVADRWNRFWFTPADPTVLGVIRIGCGLIALLTLIGYTFDLQSFLGENAWFDLDVRLRWVREGPSIVPPLNWDPEVARTEAQNPAQQLYMAYYLERWGGIPPLPFPSGLEKDFQALEKEIGEPPSSMDVADAIKQRVLNNRPIDASILEWAKALARTNKEAREYDAFRAYWGGDRRSYYSVGLPEWSVWFHVTDPTVMAVVHGTFLLITFLFLIGFCTRLTTVLSWFIALNYIHRANTTLFGVDTMMLITMMYLAIGPAGATLSVDRLIADWWRGARKRFGFGPAGENGAPANPRGEPTPSVLANVAIRMLQIHLCIIYAAAGLAKLKGASWWTGMAVWGTLANSEFAPMQSGAYIWFLQVLCGNHLLLELFLTFGTYFTLFFEISYAFLIWNRRTRWLILSMAIVLHGVIGLFMGLRTFAFMMLVMNLAFVPTPTIHWMLNRVRRWLTRQPSKDEKPALAATQEPVSAGVGESSEDAEKVGSTGIRPRRKK